MVSLAVFLCLAVAGLLLLVAIGWGGFLLLVQLGVIVREAGKPQHVDTHDYSLKQGREVGREEQQ